MKPSGAFLWKLPTLLLGKRSFHFIFWSLVISLITAIALVIMIRLGTVNSMELSLLDLKLRYRADKIPGGHSGPSSDIVLIGIDENTNKYIRLHPDPKPGPKSLTSLTLPRPVLGDILNYLTDQGARAVIFDLEFKDPKEGDDDLAQAIRRHGRVYAADRMDYTLTPFIDDQVQSIASQADENRQYYSQLFLYAALLEPYLDFQSGMQTLMPASGITPFQIGSGPYFQPFPVLGDSLWQLSQSLNFRKKRQNMLAPTSLMNRLPVYQPPEFGDITEQAYSSLCTGRGYERSYGNNERFLKLLARNSLNVNLNQRIPEAVNRQLIHCYTYPTTTGIMEALSGIGVPSIDYYEDAYIRAANTLYRGYQGNFYTYLGIRPALDLLNIQTISYQPDALFLDGRRIPLIDGQRVMINWRDPRLTVARSFRESGLDPAHDPRVQAELARVNPEKNNPLLGGGHLYRLISAIDIIRLIRQDPLGPDAQGRLYRIPHYPASGPFSFKNKIVIIGNTVTDIHRTPMSNTMFGPEVVAAVLDMFLHDDMFIQKPPPWMQWSVVALLSAGIATAIITFENLSIGFTVGVILVTLYWVLNLLAFVYLGLWLDAILPSLLMGFSLTAATLYRYYVHDREKHHLTHVFSKYVSPQIMSEIVKNPEKALDNLKGGKKELTVLFSDLQGFTHQFEDSDPDVMVSQLNEYFDVMTEIILNHGGTYDKYMGDSIMAFFGAPTDMPDHAEMACRAAIEMQKALRYLNDGWSREGRKILSHGVGISTGEMFVGNFGSKNIKNFTVMGSNVNLGARLEAYTRAAHWPVIISARTWELVKTKTKVRDLGKIQVKGFSEAVQAYGLEGITAGRVSGGSWQFTGNTGEKHPDKAG